jgi:hypothetical protein
MMVRQRVIVIALFAWLPLLVLSALEGRALGDSTAVPFCSMWKFTSATWWRFPC